ncbi:MAG: hypothetical protein M3072_15465, partial [Candidatus Dormibacteraeota bacterium]|nr:hypothetical protein [Candidatus Dormibacteraeota bacterium]
ADPRRSCSAHALSAPASPVSLSSIRARSAWLAVSSRGQDVSSYSLDGPAEVAEEHGTGRMKQVIVARRVL